MQQISEILHSKWHFRQFLFKKRKEDSKTTHSILNKSAFDTLNVNKSNQMHQENFNRLSREGRIYDTSIFDNYNTFVSKQQID